VRGFLLAAYALVRAGWQRNWQHVGCRVYKTGMYNCHCAYVELPRLGHDELRRLKSERVVPTFARDNVPSVEEPVRVSLRFDAATEAETRERLIRASNNAASVLSQVAPMWLPAGVEGYTAID
jgi:hypothetical protein